MTILGAGNGFTQTADSLSKAVSPSVDTLVAKPDSASSVSLPAAPASPTADVPPVKNAEAPVAAVAPAAKDSRLPAGYMGLFDMAVAAGYHRDATDETFLPRGSEETRLNEGYLLAHLQESILSFYFWDDNRDHRFKFGFQETISIGAAYGSTSVTSKNTGAPAEDGPEESPFGFLFAYEGAFAGVYKVNESLDVGFSYYPLLFSTFTDGERYSKLRVRYSHYMVEWSAFGKSALDVKYVMGTADNFGNHDRTVSSYIGLTWMGNGEERKGVGGGTFDNSSQYVQLSTGYLF